MKKQKINKETTIFSRCLRAPVRILTKIRDFYMNGMNSCAGHFEFGPGMGAPTNPHVSVLPKSFSASSTRSSARDDDFAELVRIASTRSLGKKVEAEFLRRQQLTPSPAAGAKVVPRSQSVGIGRIDEDKACEFGDDVKVDPEVVPRSKSHEISRRTATFNF